MLSQQYWMMTFVFGNQLQVYALTINLYQFLLQNCSFDSCWHCKVVECIT